MQITRRWLAVLVGGGLVLAACGGAADDGSDRAKDVKVDTVEPVDEATGDGGVVIQDRFAAAAASTVDAGSARTTMTITMAIPGAGDATMDAEGVTDFATGDTQITMDMSSLLGALGTDQLGALGGGSFEMEMRMVDGVMYMRFPEFMAQFMGGTTWVSVDAGDALSELGTTQGLAGPFGQADPKQYLDYLATVSSGVEEVGTETVRDVETTHYTAVIDFGAALDDVPARLYEKLGLDPDEFAQQLEQFAAVMGDGMPVDVWIDGDGLLRKMHIDMSISEAGQSVAMGVDMEMFDYGIDVHVEAPPADEVSDMGSMLGGFTGFGSGDVAA
jgi:hypothetical protein